MIQKLVVIAAGTILLALFNVLYITKNEGDNIKQNYYRVPHEGNTSQDVSRSYLINTTNCQIPDIHPLSEDILQFVKKEEYSSCTDLDLLTYIEKSFGVITLNINASLLSQYSSYSVTCCYAEVHRVAGDDDEIWFTPCKSFKESVVIIHSLVKVVCRNTFLMKVYENVHATTLMDDVQYVDDLKHNSAFKILLVGIDSISKQNLNRTMPKSYEYLEKNFINLKGYNKIAENTYPNLMAILTGQNMTQLDETCPFLTSNKNKRKDFVSTCGLIWKDYKCSGYITGFGEDYCSLSTFNFDKKGFPDPPTDYYYRPYFLAAEQLKSAGNKCNTGFCSGPESSGERVLNIAKDFSITFKDQLSFGLFWMNTFSHDSFNCPSVMDEKVLQFLSDPSFVDSLNDTIFVFFSDHGFRFGAHRRTNSGWLEERLPFIYMRIPNKFQTNFPREYKNFLTNSLRLTTPYDFHNTLQHVLKLYNTSHTSLSSPGCPKCHSLFEEVDEKRTCQDAGITQRWCTCTSYSHLPTTDSYVQRVANFVVQTINGLMRTFPDGGKCVPYFLDSVLSVGTSEVRINAENEKVNYVLVTVKTNTKAMFESTVEVPVEGPERLKIVGSISRVDRYADTSFCVRSSELKKYCYCAGGATAFKICLDLGIC